jgi:hypothetical protein
MRPPGGGASGHGNQPGPREEPEQPPAAEDGQVVLQAEIVLVGTHAVLQGVAEGVDSYHSARCCEPAVPSLCQA